jgi:RNA polymerase sigma-54 factor
VKPTLALRQSQRLSLTPELRQALGLLQLSAVELAARVQEALEGNVLLERGDEEEPTIAEAPSATPTEYPRPSTQATADWTSTELPAASSSWDDGDGGPSEAVGRGGQSLKDYLLWQLELTHLSARDAAIGAAIIDSLNDDGYLTEPLESLRLSLADSDAAPEPDEMEAVLHRLQAFDPPGVAARDLKECLFAQLRQRDAAEDPAQALAMTLVNGHLEALAAREHRPLCRLLGVGRPELDAAVALILELHPRPGAAIAGEPVDYVVPDVLVTRRDGRWLVELNPDALPRVRVNAGYAAALRRRGTGADLSQQLQEARWLVRSLKMRSETLLRVAESLVRRQSAFLDRGDEAMQPLLMKDLANELELHESTVSRVVANKYMATPRGTLAFRRFFSAELATDSGGACSATAIRAMIKKLVAQEDLRAPLSDSDITRELVSRGIHVARRTVAKYRESMTIPPAHERRRLETR